MTTTANSSNAKINTNFFADKDIISKVKHDHNGKLCPEMSFDTTRMKSDIAKSWEEAKAKLDEQRALADVELMNCVKVDEGTRYIIMLLRQHIDKQMSDLNKKIDLIMKATVPMY